MTNNHTPGPWEAVQRGDWAYLSGKGWWDFASVAVRVDGKPNAEGEANLRVTKAAPDLLAAGQDFLAELDSSGDFENWERCKTNLRAAIRKATGD
jgi:hypothetical protein